MTIDATRMMGHEIAWTRRSESGRNHLFFMHCCRPTGCLIFHGLGSDRFAAQDAMETMPYGNVGNRTGEHKDCRYQLSHCPGKEIPFIKTIGTPGKSRGFFIDGQSPMILAARVTSRWYGLPFARDCYLLPVNGFRSYSSLVVPRPYLHPTVA